MLRTSFISLTSALALFAAQGVLAQSGSPEAETDTGSQVASQQQIEYETNSKAIDSGDPAADSMSINMPLDTFKVLANARGEPLRTSDGKEVGVVQEVDYNTQGNPEIVVDLADGSKIEADRLVMTVLPGNFMVNGDRLTLATTLNELELKAEKGSVRDSENRVDVTVF